MDLQYLPIIIFHLSLQLSTTTPSNVLLSAYKVVTSPAPKELTSSKSQKWFHSVKFPSSIAGVRVTTMD